MICTPRWNQGQFDFTTIDYNGDSGVCFTAGFHVTGDPVTAWTSIAAGRAISILLAARMFESGVEEMYRTLTDLFEHYAEIEAEVEEHPSLPAMVPAFIADQKASPAFDLNE
jgi:hypothetical protein